MKTSDLNKLPQVSTYSTLPVAMQVKFLTTLEEHANKLKWVQKSKAGVCCDPPTVYGRDVTVRFYRSSEMHRALEDLGWLPVPLNSFQHRLFVRADGTWPLYNYWRGSDYVKVLSDNDSEDIQQHRSVREQLEKAKK